MHCPTTSALSIEELFGLPTYSVPKSDSGMLISNQPPAGQAIVQPIESAAATPALAGATNQALLRNMLICGAVLAVGMAAIYYYKENQKKKQPERKDQFLADHTIIRANPYILQKAKHVINNIE